MNKSLAVVVMAMTVLVGCRANDESLEDFIRTTEVQSRKELAQLKPTAEHQVAPYEVRSANEPFDLPDVAVVASQPKEKPDCWQPEGRKKLGKLEKFRLEDLRLKGIMGSGKNSSGLVQTPKGNVIRVLAGDYIGLNNGKVTQVNQSYLMINETLPDGLGCWQQRKVKLALR